MAFNKRIWKGRQGTGLNKFSINGATPVTVINQPDSVTEQGDALSAGNLNDLEDRIYDAFEDIADGTQVVGKATADASGNVITTTYETKADASDLKDAIDANSKRITNLETKAGDEIPVTYPSATYGMDGVPASVAPYGKVRELILNSRVKNQLFNPNAIATQTINGVTITNNGDGTYTLNGTATTRIDLKIYSTQDTHGFLVFGCQRGGEVNVSYWFRIGTYSGSYVGADTGNGYFNTFANGLEVQLGIASGYTCNNVVIRPQIKDLNVYFGGTVPSDASTIAQIQQNYPELLVPSDYDTGMRVDTTYSAVKSYSINICPENFEVGGINVSTGADIYSVDTLRTVGMIKVEPNTQYYLHVGSITGTTPIIIACFFDIAGNWLTNSYSGGHVNSAFIAPNNAYFMRFVLPITYGTTYLNDVQICLNSASEKAIYHPHILDTLTLPSPVTGKSAGSVHQIYYPETGEMTEPLGEVVISSSNLSDPTDNGNRAVFTVSIPSNIKYSAQTDIPNILMAGFVTVRNNLTWSAGMVSASLLTLDKIYVIMPTGTTKADMLTLHGGDTISYELATPNPNSQATDPVLDPFIKVEGNGTIRPVQSQTTQIDSAMSVDYLGV